MESNPTLPMIVVESPQSTWLFDEVRHRFRHVTKASRSGDSLAEWRSYDHLVIDNTAGIFLVFLDARRTALLRSRGLVSRREYHRDNSAIEVADGELRASLTAPPRPIVRALWMLNPRLTLVWLVRSNREVEVRPLAWCAPDSVSEDYGRIPSPVHTVDPLRGDLSVGARDLRAHLARHRRRRCQSDGGSLYCKPRRHDPLVSLEPLLDLADGVESSSRAASHSLLVDVDRQHDDHEFFDRGHCGNRALGGEPPPGRRLGLFRRECRLVGDEVHRLSAHHLSRTGHPAGRGSELTLPHGCSLSAGGRRQLSRYLGVALFDDLLAGLCQTKGIGLSASTELNAPRRSQRSARLDQADTLGGMCRAVVCRKCNRPSWKGCGAHVEQVLGHVPVADRCQCAAEKPSGKRSRWLRNSSRRCGDLGVRLPLNRAGS